MVKEIEKNFFDTFGIEKKELEYPDNFTYYPEITDRILLELICIINQICLFDYGEVDYYISSNYKDLKQEIISLCNRLANKNAILETSCEDFKQQVRTLFKEV